MRDTITKGNIVLVDGKHAIVVSFDSAKGALVEERDTKERYFKSVDDLIKLGGSEPGANLQNEFRKRWFDDTRMTPEARKKAQKREDAIEKFLSGTSKKEAAESVGLSISQFGRLLKKYNPAFGALSVAGSARGRKEGARILPEEVEKVIWFCIDNFYEGDAASLEYVYQQVVSYCIVAGLKPPSKGAVGKRLNSLGPEELCRRKYGTEAANQKFGLKPGVRLTSRALEIVQIDHTMVDLFILDDNRIPFMRPWLTILIDLHTRVILGYYISLCAPSAISCAMALVNAVFPKNKMVEAFNDPDIYYPCYGLMSIIHSDNASEFTSDVFELTCKAYGIDPQYRPPGAKHFGGHVERIIGTMMGAVHFLKGTTQSNVHKRGSIDPEKNATKTLAEFELWFARQVSIYHDTIHSSLNGKTPIEVWEECFTTPGGEAIMPPTVADPRTFALDFFPSATRTVSPKGIEFDGRFFSNKNVLRGRVRRRVSFKYDPRDLNRIFLKEKGRYVDVGISDKSAVKLSENEYLLRDLKKYGRAGKVKSERSHKLRLKNNELDNQSQKETKKAQKARKATAAHKKKTEDIIGASRPAPANVSITKPIDTDRIRRKLKWEE